jgi:hypothetical protein
MFNLASLIDRLSQIPTLVDKIKEPIRGALGRKVKWSPVEIDPVSPDTPYYTLMQRCIALALALELPVGHLALDGHQSLVSDATLEGFRQALANNAKDEENHYNAFIKAAQAYNVPETLIEEVEDIAALILSMGENPIYLAGTLELSVFFVTLAMIRKHGSPTLKSVTNYVTRDEAAHVRTNFTIIDALGILPVFPGEVNEFRVKLIEWLTSDLAQEDRDYWLEQSLEKHRR